MAKSDIQFGLSRASPQKIDEALHGNRLNTTLAKLIDQVQVPRHVLISARQVSRLSPNRGSGDRNLILSAFFVQREKGAELLTRKLSISEDFAP